MLPQWHDELQIRLAPNEVHLRLLERGLRPKCAGEASQVVERSGLEWRASVAALNACLSEASWKGARARIAISSLWARYVIVPWSETVRGDEERLAHARICLTDAFGEMGEAWRVSLSESVWRQPGVACAVPDELISTVESTCASHGVRVISIQPLLIAAYNRWRDRIPEGTGWFVSIEEGALTAARLVSNCWDRVYAARIGADWSTELQRLRTFARLVARSPGTGRVFVDAPARLRRIAGPRDPGIEWLDDTEVEMPRHGTPDSIASIGT